MAKKRNPQAPATPADTASPPAHYYPIRQIDRPEVLFWCFALSAAVHAAAILLVSFVPNANNLPYTPPVINIELSVWAAIDEVIPDPWLDSGDSEAEIGNDGELAAPRSQLSLGSNSDGVPEPQQYGNLVPAGQAERDAARDSERQVRTLAERTMSPGLRPRRVRRLDANSQLKTVESLYLNRWQRKVESMGTLYFRDEIAALNGRVTVLVTMEASGRVRGIRVLGLEADSPIGEVARKILRQASPFPPLPDALAAEVDVLEIVRVWVFQGDAEAPPPLPELLLRQNP